MINHIKLITVACIGALCMSGYAICDNTPIPTDADKTIRITSDRMESVDKKGTVVFTGHVVAIKGKMTITTDRLEVFYAKGRGKKKQLRQIIASGNVKISQGDKIGSSETAIYDKSTEVITLSGNAKVQEGENRIQGDKITLYINEERSVVESGHSRKVEAVVFSEE